MNQMKIRSFILENWMRVKPVEPHLPDYMIGGWGNGYVIIPPGHPWHGVDYDDIDVSIHGGLTFSKNAKDLDESWPINDDEKEGWVIGFDCMHFGDDLVNWPKEKVQEEADNLKKQVENYNP